MHAGLIMICLMALYAQAASTPSVVTLHAQDVSHSAASVRIALVKIRGAHNKVALDIDDIMQRISDNFIRTNLIDSYIEHECGEPPHTAQEIARFAEKGYDFVVFFQVASDGSALRSWLYDAAETTMISGTRWSIRPTHEMWANAIADDVWRRIMGLPSSFGTEIVYVKKERRGKRDQRDTLCTVSWRGGQQKNLCCRSTAIIAPSWYTLSSGKQSILFSEITPLNVRLMCWDSSSQDVRSIHLLQDDGMVVGVSQHPEGDSFVYCHSGSLWRYEKDAARGKYGYRKYDDPDGPCVAPTMLRNGDVIYGAGGKIKRLLYVTGTSIVITAEGYCVAPSCNEDAGIIVYSRRMKGIMQLWVFDMVRHEHRQISKGNGDKVDPSISSCGNFVAFCHEHKSKCSVCVLNITTGESYQVSPSTDYCVYPCWSSSAIR